MSAHGVSDGLLICTCHGADKEALKAEDLVVCERRHSRRTTRRSILRQATFGLARRGINP
jgi:hypothetical protein